MTAVNNLLSKKSVKYGLPFFICILGGSFGLKEFTNLRYQYSNTSAVKREEMIKQGLQVKNSSEVTLESEYEKVKQIDIEHWEQVRGPRPWEETPQQQ